MGPIALALVVALGITWVLDGLEVTLAGLSRRRAQKSPRLHFTNTEVGLVEQSYLAGAVGGAVFRLAHRSARTQATFLHHLAVYLVATAATALSWNLWSFAVFRLLTGAGIGGNTAIDSTIQELIPARLPRLDRPRHQRQLLDRRRSGCGGLDRSARSRPAATGFGMARRLSHRCDARPSSSS